MTEDVRECTLRSLGKMDKTYPVDSLIKALGDSSKKVRIAAAQALISYAGENFSGITKDWKSLVTRIEAPHEDHSDKPGGRYYISDCHDDSINWRHSDSGIGLKIPPELSQD